MWSLSRFIYKRKKSGFRTFINLFIKQGKAPSRFLVYKTLDTNMIVITFLTINNTKKKDLIICLKESKKKKNIFS